ncbi:hypothetical protein ACLRDC_17005 [Gluconacetobacter sacchari]|uniref:hypothetical protein n=1 Tax=Gluconacetobacter sacchari TaxID=92759 RepID=UPI0039B57910
MTVLSYWFSCGASNPAVQTVPDWKHWLWSTNGASSMITGLSSLTVGVIAGFIAWQQKKIAHQQKEIARDKAEHDILIAEKQRSISEQQKEIAREKIILDLFEKRYRIYKSFYDAVVFLTEKSDSYTEIEKYTEIEIAKDICPQARFLFNDEIFKYLNKICDEMELMIDNRINILRIIGEHNGDNVELNSPTSPLVPLRERERSLNIKLTALIKHGIPEKLSGYLSIKDFRNDKTS